MSDFGDQVSANILLCDFVAVDAGGRANMVGGGLQFLGFEQPMGTTSPFSVYIYMTSPSPSQGPVAFELLLTDAGGHVVQLPAPAGEQAMRIAQNVEFQVPSIPGVSVPKGSVMAQVQFAIGFAGGLPLQLGQSYQWRLQIDHDVKATASFYVPSPDPGPVLG